MNEFDGLLPPRRGVPPLPSRGGLAAVVGTARQRRRRRVTEVAGATTVAAMALTALVAMRPAVDRHGLTTTPTATASPSGVPTAAPTDRTRPSEANDPRPAAPPRGTTRAVAPATSGRPAAPPAAVPPARPSEPAEVYGAGYTPFRRTIVPDRAEEQCGTMTAADQPGTSVCMRVTAPTVMPSGAAVPLVAEICARYGPAMLHFPGDEEAFVWIHDSSRDRDVFRTRARPTGVGPHSVDVATGTCLRYEFDWRGDDAEGRAMSPGTYSVCAEASTAWTRKVGYAGCVAMTVVED